MQPRSILPLAFAVLGGIGCGEDDAVSTESPEDSPGVARQAIEVPQDVDVLDISGIGSGCPPGSLASAIAPDRRSVVFSFAKMVLQHPPGASFQHVNCPAVVRLHVPRGFQVSVATVYTFGYAHLPRGTYLSRHSNYSFGGTRVEGVFWSRLSGYFDGYYLFTDRLPTEPAAWSPCGEDTTFTINAGLGLDTAENPYDIAFVDTESLDARFQKIVRWEWRRC